MELVYFKDSFITKDKAVVSIDDRSYRFGDGIFETILIHNGKTYDEKHHFQRLKNGLNFFKIEIALPNLSQVCKELIQKNKIEEGYIRIIASRGINGPGAIGYASADAKPYIVVQTVNKPFPNFEDITLLVSEYRASMHLESKVNSAMLYVMAMSEAIENNHNNALILDTNGNICETASGNIFWVKDNIIYTPSTDLPFVPGTVRKKIISLSPYKVEEGHFNLDNIQNADEVFMTNIGFLVASVIKILPLKFTRKSNEVTKTLRKLLEEDIKINTN